MSTYSEMQTEFEDRYPEPDELIPHGGRPGVVYYLVPGDRQKLYEQRYQASPVRDLPSLTIKGKAGAVDTVIVMGSGDPISGAGDFAGICEWKVDRELESRTGIPANRQSPVAETEPKVLDLEVGDLAAQEG